MKKLIIAMTIVACAAMVNAAQYNWKTAAANQIYNQNATDKLASGTAYILIALC